jgi:hypothetical protein
MISYAYAFVILWLYRYVRLIVNCISSWTFKPVPLPENPTLSSQDVTVIIPTIDGKGHEFEETVRTCLETDPFEVILVTIDENAAGLKELAASIHKSRIRVLSVAKPNKRRQMVRALPEVKTKITVSRTTMLHGPAVLSSGS